MTRATLLATWTGTRLRRTARQGPWRLRGRGPRLGTDLRPTPARTQAVSLPPPIPVRQASLSPSNSEARGGAWRRPGPHGWRVGGVCALRGLWAPGFSATVWLGRALGSSSLSVGLPTGLWPHRALAPRGPGADRHQPPQPRARVFLRAVHQLLGWPRRADPSCSPEPFPRSLPPAQLTRRVWGAGPDSQPCAQRWKEGSWVSGPKSVISTSRQNK